MNSKEFSLIIEGVVRDRRPITYMDAIILYCEENYNSTSWPDLATLMNSVRMRLIQVAVCSLSQPQLAEIEVSEIA